MAKHDCVSCLLPCDCGGYEDCDLCGECDQKKFDRILDENDGLDDWDNDWDDDYEFERGL